MINSRLIKKYENRKLYCTTTSSYVTLSQIGSFIKSGEQVVVENMKKQDVTNEVLKAVIATQEICSDKLINLIKE